MEQYVLITAEDSGELVQYYKTMNPESLNETMLREISKKDIDYGYKVVKETSVCSK